MFGWLKRLLNGATRKNKAAPPNGQPKDEKAAHDPLTDTQFMQVVNDVHRRIQTKIQACKDVLDAEIEKEEGGVPSG